MKASRASLFTCVSRGLPWASGWPGGSPCLTTFFTAAFGRSASVSAMPYQPSPHPSGARSRSSVTRSREPPSSAFQCGGQIGSPSNCSKILSHSHMQLHASQALNAQTKCLSVPAGFSLPSRQPPCLRPRARHLHSLSCRQCRVGVRPRAAFPSWPVAHWTSSQQGVQQLRPLYPSSRPHLTGQLAVSKLHTLYYEVHGNPQGMPAVVVHGGPGAGEAGTLDSLQGSSAQHACLSAATCR